MTSSVSPPSSRSSGMYDFFLKMIMIGDSGVGKSCLLMRFADQEFTPSFIATVGVDFKIKTMMVEGRKVKTQIYDTAGQERFRTITTAYYRGTNGVVLVYDVSDETSFRNLKTWIANVTHHAPSASKIIVANKCDLDDDRRAVTKKMGEDLAREHGIQFLEASAKEDINVEEIFIYLIKERLKVMAEEEIKNPSSSSSGRSGNKVVLTQNTEEKKCCR
eukprot:TRINITY_DN7569_c0_g1_i1.p1 TRINITY_DN7569_c0_g1~~TRINITY_DN7569_c0_g1_i1.p1  ORF type:complete len:247 (+),score=64.65 TRINITY_DN7569_c0_g1_i1:89-742(+)